MTLIVISSQLKSQYQVPDYVQNYDSDQPTVLSEDLKGGAMQVASLAARDAIPESKRSLGMIVSYLKSTEWLVGVYEGVNVLDANWTDTLNWEILGSYADTSGYLVALKDTIEQTLFDILSANKINTDTIQIGDSTITTMYSGTIPNIDYVDNLKPDSANYADSSLYSDTSNYAFNAIDTTGTPVIDQIAFFTAPNKIGGAATLSRNSSNELNIIASDTKTGVQVTNFGSSAGMKLTNTGATGNALDIMINSGTGDAFTVYQDGIYKVQINDVGDFVLMNPDSVLRVSEIGVAIFNDLTFPSGGLFKSSTDTLSTQAYVDSRIIGTSITTEILYNNSGEIDGAPMTTDGTGIVITNNLTVEDTTKTEKLVIGDGTTVDSTKTLKDAIENAELDSIYTAKLKFDDGSSMTTATKVYSVAISDETTDITVGVAKITFRMPYAMTLTDVRLSLTTAPTGSIFIVDVKESGTTIFSTLLSIDISEKTSTTAATPVVISDASLADDAEMTIDVTQIGSTIAGTGAKVNLIGY